MRQRNFRSSLLGLMALLVLVCSLALIGCDDDGGDDFEDAQPADLQNRSFTFQDGGFFDIPEGTPFTLTFGSFGNTQTGPFTLTSGTNTAQGTVTVASCTFNVLTSTFLAVQGPAAPSQHIADPCEVNDDGQLRLTDPDTGDETTSDEPTGATGGTGGT
jgi:hypothetical protein